MDQLTHNKVSLVILGPSGAGKGTQSRALARLFGSQIFEIGNKLRLAKNKGDQFGKQIAKIIDKGDFVPDIITTKLFNQFLESSGHPKLIFDGFPRTVDQANALEKSLQKHHYPTPLIIYLNVPDGICTQRLLGRGRYDDTFPLIQKRLKNYHTLTEPVINFYANQNKVVEINGTPPIKTVTQTILNKLRELHIHGD